MAGIPSPTIQSSQLHSHSPSPPHPLSSTTVDSATLATNSRRRSLPFVFPPLFPKNTSSTSLIPSTAEGRPIPLDGSTTAHRTTTLHQLSRSQPSPRRRLSRATGPPSIKSTTTETCSQPVVVRTYSGVPPSSSTRGPVSVSTVSPTTNLSARRPSRNGITKNMVRQKGNEKGRGKAGAKLPPLDSFTFKSIIAEIQQDVGADLDRIAEICARTRYSLSNQYEVHIAPQGSGAGFLGPPSSSSLRHHVPIGPTLQAISSDDEHTGAIQKKRRNTTRRRSIAYGTLETIMSSSRSSEEDKSTKRPAAEIVEEIRGRTTMAATKDESASANSTEAQASSEQQDNQQACLSSRATLFATAIMDTSRSQTQGVITLPLVPGATLLSGPAEPQTSRNHLQTKTSREGSANKYYTREPPPRPSAAVASESVTAAAMAAPAEPRSPSGLLSGFSAWMPWKGAAVSDTALNVEGFRSHSSYAEGTLRELLRSTEQLKDFKQKGNERIT
ncbi:hypothetical protein F4776DRAFT_664788 [Hypoxylon sp. NC0597]|nr:hypothetical protein F4776DRAFT_664788 [Hypoxylon sp. NC0597]